MHEKRRVFVALHYRDHLSLGEHRQELGFSAYHWGILVSPKVSIGRDCFACDVSNGVRLDPETWTDLNLERDWYFRSSCKVDPVQSAHLLGMVMIGELPPDVQDSSVRLRLEYLPLPRRETTENCVTWIQHAITVLQAEEWVEMFDLNEFMVFALDFADQRMQDPEMTENIIIFPIQSEEDAALLFHLAGEKTCWALSIYVAALSIRQII